jgi:hypothetical protein
MISDVFDIYEQLWLRARGDGAVVEYYEGFPDDPPGRNVDKLRHDLNGATGWFDADIEGGCPNIKIYRLACGDDIWTPSRFRGPDGAHLPPPDLHDELITLAHEYGHLRSFLVEPERQEWNQYNAAAQRRDAIKDRVAKQSRGIDGSQLDSRKRAALLAELSDDDYNRILREETLAWKIGRETLAELLMTDFVRYDVRREHGLHAHRYRLGREDGWASDLEGPSTTE